MRSILCRLARLSRFAAVGAAAGAMMLPAFAQAQQATQTSLSAETRDVNGRTQATLSVAVVGDDGQPASGAVVIQDGRKQLAGAALDAEGKAQIAVGLLPGGHDLRAVFAGDSQHQASSSEISAVSAAASATPNFTISVNPASLSLTPGQSGTVTASLKPVNASSLSAPMFVTLSCSGLPDQSSCSFTPENVEILPNATAAINSSMLITTAQGTGSLAKPAIKPDSNPVSWAVLLPGALGFAGLTFAVRRRRWMSRMSVIAFIGLVTTLGMTACAPRYNYYNHGPPHNRPTPSGSYTLKVTAQSSNGVAATTNYATLALTVK
ncbi:Ig-like domain-containing protein [Occallatibacter riparius]|uniref:Ig-like domain-containing protein n=1 Tax=Occallatibacter riparius TaxID=1002689 RepID=A0A9J7BVT6_9BACT|nr:Ig-like domain-containing protein [Occallatibacter riparius]UWZ85906.1 Ig-like domain-containing protein [Occallatibacter riparius]